MIKDSTIEAVRNADIYQVVNHYIKLDRHNKACCPFHDEKTPSFSVDNKKGIYKCFGCGVGGDALHFVMEKEHLDFIPAVEKIASICGISVEYEDVDKDEMNRRQELMQDYNGVLSYAIKKYREILWIDKQAAPWQYITQKRKLNEETIIKWQIGYAPDEWRTIAPNIIESGRYQPAKDIGIIKTSKGQNYDAYRNRIIIPIKNHRGEYVGIGARLLPSKKKEGEAIPPAGGLGGKYINSPESKRYQKSKILFGLYESIKKIKTQKEALLVEGYLDVISMHQAGFQNTIATCGTSLTNEQSTLLKRHTDHVVIIRDGDEAGHKAMQRDIPILLQQGFKVNAVMLEEGKDPDDLANSDPAYLKELIRNAEDAVMLLATEWVTGAGDDVFDTSRAIIDILNIIARIPSPILQSEYVKKVCKANRWKLTDVRKQFDAIIKEKSKGDEKEEDPFKNLPPDVDKDDVIKHGFFERKNKFKTGYYFLNGDGGTGKAMTNFVIQPLYHIDSETDNRRMISINNGFEESILEMPSEKMLSADYVLGTLFKSGHYLPKEGFSKNHLYKILNKISGNFPRAFEIDSLGWQPEGFFAFNNKVYLPAEEGQDKGSLESYNEYGIAPVGEKLYLSPSVSKIQEHYRGTDSVYENDKYLNFIQSNINFEKWAELLTKVYEQNAWMAIPFAIATIMRDIIRPVTKIPHLYLYGQIQSGKSEFGESITYLFFSGKDSSGEPYKPMNLNQGTTYAFHNRLERFTNVPNALNEFDENAIPDEWFRAIKAAYDGEGREKGRKEKNRATVQKVNCTIILMGQYLGSKDDNSVITRSLPLPLRKKDNRTDDEVNNFFKLKEYEKNGLSGILLEMMDWRPIFKKQFKEKFLHISKEMQESARAKGDSISDRIVKNLACMRTCIELISDKVKLPFSKSDFKDYAFEFMQNMNVLVTKTSGTSEFWGMVEFLLDRAQIIEGFDFFIEAREHVNLRSGRDKEFRKDFNGAKKMLFIRLSNVHKLYREQSRRTGNDAGLNETTLLLYMKEQPYWIGNAKSETFTTPDGRKIKTSCIVVDYDLIDINLERYEAEADEARQEITVMGEVVKDAVETTRKGVFKFMIVTINQIEVKDIDTPKTESLIINCFTADPTIMWEAQREKKVQVTGLLSIHKTKYKETRTLDVTAWKPESQIKQEEDKEEEFF